MCTAGRELAKKVGVEIKQLFLTSGDCDIVLIVDAPDGDNVAKFALLLGSLGSVRTRMTRLLARSGISKAYLRTALAAGGQRPHDHCPRASKSPNTAMPDRWAPNFGRAGRPACDDHAGRPTPTRPAHTAGRWQASRRRLGQNKPRRDEKPPASSVGPTQNAAPKDTCDAARV